jgi:hypothetical protein
MFTVVLLSFSSSVGPLYIQFEDAVLRATGEDPHFPPSIEVLKSLPHRFTWLRKSRAVVSDAGQQQTDKTATTDAEAAAVPDAEAESDTWRSQWISFLKREIESV